MFYRHSLALIIATTLMAIPASSFAGRAKNPLLTRKPQPHYIQKKMSYEEFEQILRKTISRIDTLEPLWHWRQKRRFKNQIFAAGGQIRMALRWMNQYLQTHSVNQLKKRLEGKKPINLSKVDARGSLRDIDLYLPDRFEEERSMNGEFLKSPLRDAIPEYQEASLDILPERFYQESIKKGATTLSKVRINPDQIQDPFQALRAYYQGRLEFQIVPQEIYWDQNSEFILSTRTTDIIRFVKIFYELPELTVDPNTIRDLSKLPREDIQFVPDSELFGLTSTFQVQSLKLFKQMKRDTLRYLKALNDLKIIDTFNLFGFRLRTRAPLSARPGVSLAEEFPDYYERTTAIKKRIKKLIKNGFTLTEIANIDYAMSWTSSSEHVAVQWLEQLLPLTQSAEQYDQILSWYLGRFDKKEIQRLLNLSSPPSNSCDTLLTGS